MRRVPPSARLPDSLLTLPRGNGPLLRNTALHGVRRGRMMRSGSLIAWNREWLVWSSLCQGKTGSRVVCRSAKELTLRRRPPLALLGSPLCSVSISGYCLLFRPSARRALHLPSSDTVTPHRDAPRTQPRRATHPRDAPGCATPPGRDV